jgi:light-regulated signal transduction histidine kinase (bacteriophytochrome)
MGQLIDDLLHLSRVGRAELQRRPVDLSAVALAVAAALQQSTPGREVQILIPDGVVADGDRGLLRVVLENLLGNAWKFTTNITHPRIEFGASERDGVLTYFIQDNGAGFDMADAKRLFAPFQRRQVARPTTFHVLESDFSVSKKRLNDPLMAPPTT